jgi:orotate phosphoribosyltransferase
VDRADRTQELLKTAGALKSGHFLLSSGLHSDRYCQCAALFEQPAMAGEVASLMADALPTRLQPQVVLAPALGGILWGYELARQLGIRSIFAERQDGTFALRRGFQLHPGERVLIAEDVVTTGKSVLELKPLVEGAGAVIAGFAAVVDRSQGRFSPGAPFHALTALDFEVHQPAQCPLCAAGIPLVKPGSRALPGAKP